MAKAARAASETAADKSRVRLRLIDALSTFIIYGWKYGTLAFIAYWGFDALKAFAGKGTDAAVVFKIVTDLRIDQGIAYLFGLGGVAYGYKERRAKQKAVGHLGTARQEAEKRVDPGRTSSNLTPRGTSRPEDQP